MSERLQRARARRQALGRTLDGPDFEEAFSDLVGVEVEPAGPGHWRVTYHGRWVATFDEDGELACGATEAEQPSTPPIGSEEFKRGQARFRTRTGVLAAVWRRSLAATGRPVCEVRARRQPRPRGRSRRTPRATRAGPSSDPDDPEPGGDPPLAAGPIIAGAAS